jgi:hypothetical protein
MSEEPIARYYDASKNPDGAFLIGVPLADLSESQWAALPAWLQLSVDASGWYRKTAPPKVAPPKAPEEE